MKTVPEVTGKSQDEAQRSLTDAGLAVGAVTDAYSEDVPPGPGHLAVGRRRHVARARLGRRHRPVQGPRAPDRAHPERTERERREERHRGPRPRRRAHRGLLRHGRRGDRVISPADPRGSTLHRGDSVAYTVSKGPEKVAIPDVVGLQREEARSLLEGAGFTVKEEAILGGFFGTVRSSDPAAGTMTKKGSTVTITIV